MDLGPGSLLYIRAHINGRAARGFHFETIYTKTSPLTLEEMFSCKLSQNENRTQHEFVTSSIHMTSYPYRGPNFDSDFVTSSIHMSSFP